MGRDERPHERPIVDAVVLRENIRLLVHLATATEVKTIDASAEVSAIRFGTGEREHANSSFAGSTRHTRQVPDVPPCTWKRATN